MALPLNIAMTAAEISSCNQIPGQIAWMACHFSPGSQGVSNLPTALPPGSMLILNDREPLQGHSPSLVAQQLRHSVEALECESVLLDFQRPPGPESAEIVQAILEALPCPTAVSEGFAVSFTCPVFLPPPPLHIPLKAYLAPWQGREIWLEAALCQEIITVTKDGTSYAAQFPRDIFDGGWYDEQLLCCYTTSITPEVISFTLFDTPDTLSRKLSAAEALGVARAVGLYQELGA